MFDRGEGERGGTIVFFVGSERSARLSVKSSLRTTAPSLPPNVNPTNAAFCPVIPYRSATIDKAKFFSKLPQHPAHAYAAIDVIEWPGGHLFATVDRTKMLRLREYQLRSFQTRRAASGVTPRRPSRRS